MKEFPVLFIAKEAIPEGYDRFRDPSALHLQYFESQTGVLLARLDAIGQAQRALLRPPGRQARHAPVLEVEPVQVLVC